VVLPGYPCAIGLPVDCRITDRWADPPGMTEYLHEEPLVRLDRPFACYEPPGESPEVGPLPAGHNGFVTFGLFHQRPKLNEKAALVWADILRQTPNSRLLIHNVYGAEPPAPEEFEDPVVKTLVANGIGMDRIQLVGRLPLLDHLALFNQIDIALDAFPRAGMTTTLESLWMGVPVITLAGQAHMGRVGISFLTAVGLEELVASDANDYAAKAVEFALDVPRLRMLRSELRTRMQNSPLTDAAGYARAIEQVYQALIDHAVAPAPSQQPRI
jgi:predicted O-linked N-acetylglucosamine transferase (SPINDLY family)